MTTSQPPSGVPALFSVAFGRDPWPTYRWLQRDAPVYADPASRMIVVTRYADCKAALKSPAMSAAGGQQDRRNRAGVPRSMLTTDGKEHDLLRRPGLRLLGPSAVRRLTERLVPDVAALVSALPDGEPVDVLAGLAEPFATAVMAALLVLGTDEDVAELDLHARAVQASLNPVPDPSTALQSREAMRECSTFLGRVLDAAPAGTPLADLRDDTSIERGDAVGILSLSLVGGWSPLAEVFTSAAQALAADPRLAAGEDGLRALLEEVLRWHTPIPFVARRASETVPLPSGGAVPAGAMVLLMIAAANRDPEVFPEPDVVDPHRPADGHAALGVGPHFCLGAALIRATVPLALRALLERGVRLAKPGRAACWQPLIFPRRIMSAPVVVGVSARAGHATES